MFILVGIPEVLHLAVIVKPSTTHNRLHLLVWAVCIVSLIDGVNLSGAEKASPAIAEPVAKMVNKYCLDCHDHESMKGELDLEILSFEDVLRHSEPWERVVRRLNARQMPPAKRKSRPTEEEYQSAINSLVTTLDTAAAAHP